MTGPPVQRGARRRSSQALLTLAGTMMLAAGSGCQKTAPPDSLIVTQVPPGAQPAREAATLLDQRYPAGSRVVLVPPPYQAKDARVLSQGLLAAGGAVVVPGGTSVYFAGKADAGSAWQIFQARVSGGRPRPVTSVPGGAMDPAVTADGSLVFSSPVPKPDALWNGSNSPALFAQSPGGSPRQLTFGGRPALEPTTLTDGRILFVSGRPVSAAGQLPRLGLFTINPDGTEFTSFALDRDGAPLVRRPRELPPGRVGFLAGPHDGGLLVAETVRMARPFASRAPLISEGPPQCTSIGPGPEGGVVACWRAVKPGASEAGSVAVHLLAQPDTSKPSLLFDDPAWDDTEAAMVQTQRPMGHISSMNPGKDSGSILCLNAGFVRSGAGQEGKPDRVRVVTLKRGERQVLGEVPVEADGSFMIELPADQTFGLETLDSQGEVLQQLPPSLWVRPGENRTCIGCHEPSNRSPRNQRPLAIAQPPVRLQEKSQAVAQQNCPP